MEDLSWIYIAGMVDSRSYIGMTKVGSGKWISVVKFSGLNAQMMRRIRDVAGSGHIDGNRLVFRYRQAAVFLKKVLPHLETKRRHAEIIIELQDRMDGLRVEKPHRPLFSQIVTQEEIAARDALYEEMRGLNSGKK